MTKGDSLAAFLSWIIPGRNGYSFHYGFSLLELLVTMAIISILAVIAYPSYQSHIIKTRRNDGKISLLHLAAQMERYYATHNSYQGAIIGGNKTSTIQANNISSEGWYTMQISQSNRDSYVLQAIPRQHQSTSDKSCGTLTLNQQGIRGSSINKESNKCWS